MGRSACLLTHGVIRGGTSDAVAFEGQHKHHLLASYNSQIGRPTGVYSGAIGGLLADGPLVPAAFGRCNEPTPAVVRRQHTVVASEIDPRFWHEGRQSGGT